MTNETKAPFCPVSFSQEPTNPRGTAPIQLPSIPIATDLPSLIRSVNIMRDILRTLTTSLTVNNTYFGQAALPKLFGKKNYIMSDYTSDWYQTSLDTKDAVVYNKANKKIDKDQKVYINRIDAVHLRNNARDNDQSFDWRYLKKPDAEETGDKLFEEDFFERVVNVKWGKKKPPDPVDIPVYATLHLGANAYDAWDTNWPVEAHEEYRSVSGILVGGMTNPSARVAFFRAIRFVLGISIDKLSAEGFSEYRNIFPSNHPMEPFGQMTITASGDGIGSMNISCINDMYGTGDSGSFAIGTFTVSDSNGPWRVFRSLGVVGIQYNLPNWADIFIKFEGRLVRSPTIPHV